MSSLSCIRINPPYSKLIQQIAIRPNYSSEQYSNYSSEQYSNYSSEQYLEDFDRQLGQPIRDPHSIFSKSALQRETESSKPTNSSSLENTSTVPENGENQAPPLRFHELASSPLKSKRNLRQTEKYLNYRSDILKQRSHPTTSQITASIKRKSHNSPMGRWCYRHRQLSSDRESYHRSYRI